MLTTGNAEEKRRWGSHQEQRDTRFGFFLEGSKVSLRSSTDANLKEHGKFQGKRKNRGDLEPRRTIKTSLPRGLGGNLSSLPGGKQEFLRPGALHNLGEGLLYHVHRRRRRKK